MKSKKKSFNNARMQFLVTFLIKLKIKGIKNKIKNNRMR